MSSIDILTFIRKQKQLVPSHFKRVSKSFVIPDDSNLIIDLKSGEYTYDGLPIRQTFESFYIESEKDIYYSLSPNISAYIPSSPENDEIIYLQGGLAKEEMVQVNYIDIYAEEETRVYIILKGY